MERGDVLGHETMGEVVDIGRDNNKLKIGDRVVVPFTISCGECFFCKRGYYSGCEKITFAGGAALAIHICSAATLADRLNIFGFRLRTTVYGPG
jgi:threonine dehydrogenase-like Zn-dependent dehydrogenase